MPTINAKTHTAMMNHKTARTATALIPCCSELGSHVQTTHAMATATMTTINRPKLN
jgi:hypothetical protein